MTNFNKTNMFNKTAASLDNIIVSKQKDNQSKKYQHLINVINKSLDSNKKEENIKKEKERETVEKKVMNNEHISISQNIIQKQNNLVKINNGNNKVEVNTQTEKVIHAGKVFGNVNIRKKNSNRI